jgi:hypothetical protein
VCSILLESVTPYTHKSNLVLIDLPLSQRELEFALPVRILFIVVPLFLKEIKILLRLWLCSLTVTATAAQRVAKP